MPEEIENIEARLCAYIDGELDEAARRDIERHLESNPQHRRLMREMARARELLQELPRVPAPPEIEEAIHSHLERSVLLDDSAAASAPLRISRWPQIISAAAIILLAAGLGIIVWLVIRPPTAARTTAVNLPPPLPATAPSHVRMETKDKPLAKQDFEQSVRPSASEESFAARKSAASQPVVGQSAESGGLAMAEPHPRPPSMADDATSTAESVEQMGLVAVTEDPPQAELQLRAFLSSQGLSAKSIDLPSGLLLVMDEPQKAFIVRDIALEQVQSLRHLLDGSAATTLDLLNEPVLSTQPTLNDIAAPTSGPAAMDASPSTEPSPERKVDLLILVRREFMQPETQNPPEQMTKPATQPDVPTTAPGFEDYQMP
jgi:hypothetical protein